ncbi:putative Oxidoreductase [Seiridium unicorne]|uniref:Oxidoreductase n=1 Tax=Seiridium unicorne TaxID=138068 RepID=A0ABR2V191_9PEZI
MPSKKAFNVKTTSEEVVAAFGEQVKGKTFVLTDAAKAGIGGHAAVTLALREPAHIIIASRTEENVKPILEEIAFIDSSVKTTFVQLDLTDRDSVRHAADKISAIAPKVDVLISNAGIMAIQEYTTDKHGVELQLSANYIGHFLLTNLLVPNPAAAGQGSRVVNVVSNGYRVSPFRFDDWNFSGGKTYDPCSGYGQAKTAEILFAWALTKRLKSRGVTATALHPGAIWETGLGAHLDISSAFNSLGEVTKRNTAREWSWETPEAQRKTMTQGAATTLVAALDPEIPVKAPAYLANGHIHEALDYATDPEKADKLWSITEEILGQKFEH